MRAVGPRGRRAYWLLFSVFILFISTAWAAQKPTNADCLACHSDATLTHEVEGKQVSLAVDEGKFNNSIHGSILGCVDCHDDVKSAPHEVKPGKLSCSKCHAEADQGYCPQHPRPSQGEGGRQRPHLHLLPRRPARDPAAERSQVQSRSRQHSGHLRLVPRAEIRHGEVRPEFSHLRQLRGERPRQGGGRRFHQGRRLHRLPRQP